MEQASTIDARKGAELEEETAAEAAEAAAEERRRSGQQAGVSRAWMDAGRTVRLVRGPGGRVTRAGESGAAPAEEVGIRSSPRYVSRGSQGARLHATVAWAFGLSSFVPELPCSPSSCAPTTCSGCAVGQACVWGAAYSLNCAGYVAANIWLLNEAVLSLTLFGVQAAAQERGAP